MAQSLKPYITLVMDKALVKKVEDFQFKNRFKSRAAAMKWLMQWALTQNPKPPTPSDES